MTDLCARVPLLGLLLVLTSCGASQYRAKPMGEGTWRVECLDNVDRCLREAERVCKGKGYYVISGKQETKMFGAEEGYQTGADLHSVEFACGRPEPPPIRLVRDDEPVDPDLAPPPKPKSAPKGHHCTPGATQRCVGPGACDGGQSCNAEGTAFLPCDCGKATENASAPAPEGAPGPTSTAPTSTAPATSAAPQTDAAPAKTPASGNSPPASK